MSTPLVAFNQQTPAHLLVSYLNTQGISSSLATRKNATTNNLEYVVVVTEAADIDVAMGIAEAFVQNPSDPKYQQAAWEQGEATSSQANSRLLPNLALFEQAKQAPFTALILMVCVLVYGFSHLGFFGVITANLLMQPLGILAENHQWWRLLGPAFIHFSVLHIVFNLLWWGTLGARIENTMGVSMLFLLFFVSAIVSNVTQGLFSEPHVELNNVYAFGGLSGVVYAVMGFVWWIGWLRPEWGISIQKPIIGFMLVWLVLGYADILWVSMANAAHTSGLISGCVMAFIVAKFSAQRR